MTAQPFVPAQRRAALAPTPRTALPAWTPPPGSALSGRLAERARRYYELVDAREHEELLELFAPDARYHRPGYEPFLGRDALRRFYEQDRVIVEGRHTVGSLVVSGWSVAVQGEFRGVLRSGERTSLLFADFFELNGHFEFTSRDTYFFAPLV